MKNRKRNEFGNWCVTRRDAVVQQRPQRERNRFWLELDSSVIGTDTDTEHGFRWSSTDRNWVQICSRTGVAYGIGISFTTDMQSSKLQIQYVFGIR